MDADELEIETPDQGVENSAEGADQGSENQGANEADKAAAKSPGADEDANKDRQTLLSAVKKAVDPKAGAKNGKSSTPKQGSDASSDAGNPKPDANAADPGKPKNDSDVPFHNHPRWKEVVGERDRYKGEIEQLRPDADQFRKITSFMSEHDLSVEEVSRGFTVMSLLKNDPQKAYEVLSPIMDELRGIVGEKLPDDLRQKVEQGLVDEGTAKELARERNARAIEQSRTQRQNERNTEANAARAAGLMADAVNGWEREIKGRDLDYAKKRPMVEDRIRVLLNEARAAGKPPRTAEEAKAIAIKAYEDVSERLKSIVPRRQPTDPAPASGQSSTTAQPKPSNLFEAIKGAARGSR